MTQISTDEDRLTLDSKNIYLFIHTVPVHLLFIYTYFYLSVNYITLESKHGQVCTPYTACLIAITNDTIRIVDKHVIIDASSVVSVVGASVVVVVVAVVVTGEDDAVVFVVVVSASVVVVVATVVDVVNSESTCRKIRASCGSSCKASEDNTSLKLIFILNIYN